MKRLMLLLVMADVMACLLAGCARAPQELSGEQAYQRFVGTWVNTKYPGTLAQSQVTVIRADYIGEDRLFPGSADAAGEWKIKVRKTWVDEKGDSYCQFDLHYLKGKEFDGTALMRVDKKRKVWEINSREAYQTLSAEELEPIERIDPQMANYWIYYRR